MKDPSSLIGTSCTTNCPSIISFENGYKAAKEEDISYISNFNANWILIKDKKPSIDDQCIYFIDENGKCFVDKKTSDELSKYKDGWISIYPKMKAWINALNIPIVFPTFNEEENNE
jgi:hypothetical protein